MCYNRIIKNFYILNSKSISNRQKTTTLVYNVVVFIYFLDISNRPQNIPIIQANKNVATPVTPDMKYFNSTPNA